MFSPRVAWTLALGCVAWHGFARTGQMLDVATTYSVEPMPLLVVGAAVIVGLVAAQGFLAIERGPPGLLLAAMMAGTLVPVPLLGGAWPSIGGLVGAATLLTVRPRWSPALVAVVLGADALLYWQFSQAAGAILGHRVLMNVNVAIALFVVIRLARLVQQAHEARLAAAHTLVELEKQSSAQWLRSALGSRLADVVAATRRMSAASTIVPDDVTHLARTAHRAAETARQAVDARGRVHLPRLIGESAPGNDHALSWAVSVFITVVFVAVALLNLLWLGDPTATTWVVATLVSLSAAALHLYHGGPRPEGEAPRWWPWTLTAQALLVIPAARAGGEALFLPHIVLLAGSAATRLHAPWLWFLPPVALTGAPVMAAWLSPSWSGWASANLVGGLATMMIVLYALCHLPSAAALLRRTRAAFTQTAVAAERSNFARDVHDLLGLHLAAMVLNAELAVRAGVEDPGGSRERVDTVRRCAQRALLDLRSIHDHAVPVTAEREIAEAASVLRAAGIHVTVEVLRGAVPQRPSRQAEQVAGIVVREASTNIVRHSQAGLCRFRLGIGTGAAIELDIINDGARTAEETLDATRATGDRGGLGNLAARVDEVGGWLTAARTQGTFRLTAWIPTDSPGAHRVLRTPVLNGCDRLTT